MRQHLERAVLQPERLTLNGYEVLRTVFTGEAVTPNQIAIAAGIPPGTLTGIVHQLADRDLLERREGTDRRVVVLALTAAGRRLVRRVARIVDAEESRLLDGLPDRRLADARAILRELSTRLHDRS